MPKKIITETTLLIALHDLDKWSGKLTWEAFAEHLAKRLGEKRISRHTLLSYPPLVDAFNKQKNALREVALNVDPGEPDVTLDVAKQLIATLETKVARLEKQIDLHREQFVRWQHNTYMKTGADMEKLIATLDQPLAAVSRR